MMKTNLTLSRVKRILIFLFVLIGSGVLAQGVPEYMYFKFDAAGNQQNYASAPVGTNPATLTGLTVGGTGQFGTALVGDFVASHYLNTGWATSLPSTGFTISMWLNNMPSDANLYYLFGDINASSFRCFLNGAAGAGNVLLRGGGLTDVTVTGVMPGPTVLTFVYTGTAVKYFKNGVLAGSLAQPTVTISGTGPFFIGAYSNLQGMPTGGLMDEFRMYNRALSDAEVGSTWNQMLPLGGPPIAVTTAATAITGNSATLNGTMNANGASTSVTFEYGLTTSYGTTVPGVPSPVTGNTATAVSTGIAGLNYNTTYHYRVNGVNTYGNGNGSDMTFTTLGPPPVVVTTAATAVLSTTATLNGTVNANNASTAVSFEYGTTTAYGSTVTGVPATVTGTTVTPCAGAATGLLPNTLYHFRIKGQSGNGTSNGNDMTFTTTGPPPTVVTTAATGVTGITALLNGTVNANGVTSTVTFEYGLTTAYGTIANAVPSTVNGSVVTPVSLALTGLLPGNTYHFRVDATNSNGTSNGNDMTFTTPTLPPTVITYAATATTSSTATLNGLVNASGASTTASFDWGLTTAYGTTVAATPSTVTGNPDTQVSTNLTGLTNGTTYHYRVTATNVNGPALGNDMTFTAGCFQAASAGIISGPGQVCQGGCGYVYFVPPIANASGYIWTIPVGGTITSGTNTNSITVCYSPTAVPGYVFVYGTATCGNGAPSQMGVAMNPPSSPTITGPATACASSTGNIYTTQSGMSNYIWTVSAGGLITAGGTSNSPTVTVTWQTTGAKTVSVNYNSTAGCPALSPTVYNVNVNALPVPTITGPSPACANNPGQVYTTQAGMTGYVWTVSAGGTITAGGGAANNTVTVTWNTSGSQQVTVNYNNAGGCAAASPVVYPVTVNNSPVPTISGTSTLCVNSGYYNYTTEAGMIGYQWTVSPGGSITYGGGSNVAQIVWPNAGAQWVKVNYNNGTGCSASSPTLLNVTVNGYPGPAGPITGTSTVCAGANAVAYSIAPIPNAVSYVWNLPAGASIATGQGTSSITVNYSAGAVSGNIVAFGNSVCGNGTGSPAFAVVVNPLPAAAGAITGPSSVCQGATGVVYSVADIPGALSYTWTTPDDVTVTAGANTSTITVDFSATAANGFFNVAGTNACGNGAASANYNVTVNPIPATPVVTNNGYIAHSSSPAGNQWYKDGTIIVGATAQNYDCSPTGTGNYSTIVTINGCVSAVSNEQLVITSGLDSHAGSAINLFPVPNDGTFKVNITTASTETFTIRIYSSLGTKIFEDPKVEVNKSIQKVIDLRPVDNGVYTIIIENSLTHVVKKIVVNK